VNGSAAIARGAVYVPVAKPGAPSVAAFRLSDGRPLWKRRVDNQKGADVFGSPVVFDPGPSRRPARGKKRRPTANVYIGVSGEFGEVNDPEVHVRGAVVALDAATGKLRWKRYTVPPRHDGGSVWNTPAIDTHTRRLYVGTGNAYHAPSANTTDAVLAFDARSGRIVDKVQATAGDVWNGTEGRANGPDYDFGASLNLLQGPGGRKLVGAGQKSGVYWAFDRRTLDPVWNATTGPGAPVVGGIVGSTAYDGKRVYGPDTPAGEIWALGPDGGHQWVSTDGGPLHFSPVSVANGVVYSTDMSATLTAREATSGAVLAKLPLGAPSWGGVSVAGGSVFAVTGTQGSSGYVVAYRPRG
jgi:polyvinyl alcohol dehydrogenase (cytochrome)